MEGQIGRFKQVIGPMLRFQTAGAQATEIAMAVEVLNRRLDLGRPNSVRRVSIGAEDNLLCFPDLRATR